MQRLRPFQENKSPKNGEFSEGKTSGLGGFNFWNYLRPLGLLDFAGAAGELPKSQVILRKQTSPIYTIFCGKDVR
jgi:hypothetical protein